MIREFDDRTVDYIRGELERFARDREGKRRKNALPVRLTPVDKAIELLHRAEHFERYGYAKLHEAICGKPIDFRTWSVIRRLEAIATPEQPRQIIDAFVAAGMVEEAIEYIHDIWERTPYVPSRRSEIGDAFRHSMRSRRRRKCIGFKEPPMLPCAVPPPEREQERSHRHTTRTLVESYRGATPYFRTIVGREPQVARTDELEWEHEWEARMRPGAKPKIAGNAPKIQLRRKGSDAIEPVYPRRETRRAFARALDKKIEKPLPNACTQCQRFAPDCTALGGHWNENILRLRVIAGDADAIIRVKEAVQ